MTDQNFTIQPSTRSHCKQCDSLLDLLANEAMDSPIFFICWNCHKVFIAGKGEVPILQ